MFLQQIENLHAHVSTFVFVRERETERNRAGVKVSAQSHSPNLITVEFSFVPEEYKLSIILKKKKTKIGSSLYSRL